MKKVILLFLMITLFSFFLLCQGAFETQLPKQKSFEMFYTGAVKDLPPDAEKIEMWLPFPKSSPNQVISEVKIESPLPTSLHYDSEYGNAILYLSTDLSQLSAFEVKMSFKIKRLESRNADLEFREANKPVAGLEPIQRFFQANELVPIDGKIKELSAQITQDKKGLLSKAKAIYDFVASNMVYDKTGVGWGRGDAIYACDIGKGNCTDYHSLFIALARASEIPAKFVIGFSLPQDETEGEISGYHCWAEFYLPGYGWIPVDISEGDKNPPKRDYFFGNLSENRVEFTTGRDIFLAPAQKGERLNFFIYPYVEIDGKPYPKVEKHFYFKSI